MVQGREIPLVGGSICQPAAADSALDMSSNCSPACRLRHDQRIGLTSDLAELWNMGSELPYLQTFYTVSP